MLSTKWLGETAERAVRTFLQAWLGTWIVIENVTLSQLFDVDVLTVGVVAAVGSILVSLAARKTGDPTSASLIE